MLASTSLPSTELLLYYKVMHAEKWSHWWVVLEAGKLPQHLYYHTAQTGKKVRYTHSLPITLMELAG
tara:strand:- start:1231 stop:1431 length:201 start_codon:yes stop_codon:yes gene_type:complete